MGKLYLVPTPIGNLDDITLRAIKVLQMVDIVLAEDTRTTQVTVFGGETVALVSDAGTPGISDPGFLLVRTCLEHGVEVETLPGPTAFVPALINSGFSCDRFCFEGFLPQKKGRSKRLQQLLEESRTMIFYESPYRLVKTLIQFAELFGADREAAVSRELTKKFEENVRGTLQELIDHFSAGEVKGEIVIVLSGKPRKSKHEADSDDEE